MVFYLCCWYRKQPVCNRGKHFRAMIICNLASRAAHQDFFHIICNTWPSAALPFEHGAFLKVSSIPDAFDERSMLLSFIHSFAVRRSRLNKVCPCREPEESAFSCQRSGMRAKAVLFCRPRHKFLQPAIQHIADAFEAH